MNAKKVYNLELEETFEEVNLIAIHSSLEGYQLAFYLNNTLNSNFKRSENDLSLKGMLKIILFILSGKTKCMTFNVLYFQTNTTTN